MRRTGRPPASDQALRDNMFYATILDTAANPTATFTLTAPVKLTAVPPEGTPTTITATGDLMVHGVTKSVILDVVYEGTGKDPWGGERAGFSGSTTIDRKDFGLRWNQALETGGVLVGDKVELMLEIEAVKQAAQKVA